MLDKIFKLVSDRVEEALNNKGFKKSNQEEKYQTLFIGESSAYLLKFNEQNKQFELKSCSVSDCKPNNQWKNISSWLFDPEEGSKKDAEYIAADFCETLTGPKKAPAQVAKKKKDNDNKVDIIFFMNRLANILPGLKEEIDEEKQSYDTFRMVTFTENNVMPKINMFLLQNNNSKQFKKFCNVLSDAYNVGDLDVRSTVTFLILNNIKDENQIKKLKEELSDELNKAWKASYSIKDKKIKPEKVKKNKKGFIASTLANQ